ncbi:MAG: hypothetical protein RMK99_16915 [Anaerolineales bacterium]|nr:hypothetical protein [Anaerolineales bacterium]
MPQPLHSKVLLLIYNPRFPLEGNCKLSEVMRWNDPDVLAQQYIADVRECSYGLANFEIVERIEVDGFPVKADGFAYTPEDYLRCWRARAGFHQPDAVDYHRLLDEFAIVPRINSGAVDEVWLFGFPYAGYYESIMVGPGAVWCNAPPLARSDAKRRFIIMGFNYERGVGEMLESLGHRAESVLGYVYRHTHGEANLWERFTRYDKTHPGRAECGNVHFAPNSERDYDWGNPRFVVSRCHAWLNFPDLDATARRVNCAEWGGGDIRLHHLWWLRHFPHVDGASDGVDWNWWRYVIAPDQISTEAT